MIRIKESTRVTHQTVYHFLRRYAKSIHINELEPISRGRFGDSIVFHYGTDKILKVPKNGHRRALIKEAKLSQYLNSTYLSASFAEPLSVHQKGFYAVFRRIPGRPVSSEMVMAFTSGQFEAFARALGRFLSFLHSHEFPSDLLEYVPRPAEDLSGELRRALRMVKLIEGVAAEEDVSTFVSGLERLGDSLHQIWALTHNDLSLNHVFSVDGGIERLGFIDFAGAQVCDPSVDFSELALDLMEEGGIHPNRFLDMLLKHYDTYDHFVRDKVEFRILAHRIRRVYRQVLKSTRGRI